MFTPYTHGSLTLPHRVAMAPLTRNRAKDTVPGELNAEYYAQRASAAILITEGTHPSADGQAYLDIAGLHSDEHQEGWAQVADAVAEAGDAKLVVQLMHGGRVAHPYYTDGETPIAPSAVRAEGEVFTPDGQAAYVTPRALETDELAGVRDQFVDAARRAVAAGAYGVELHAANGYLLHQFLSEKTNQRTDGYGTDVAGRIRFVVETVDAVVAAIGAERTAIRISPGHPVNDIEEAAPRETYAALLDELARHDLLYVHVLETTSLTGYSSVEQARELFPGTLMINGGFKREFGLQEADEMVRDGKADLVAIGRAFLANPDLPRRLQEGAPLNDPDKDTFYSGGEKGYTDYPALDPV
ncbi:MAG: alkene reductase [Solirubrobacteraceae bacterium]|nr:alkene reductase [Solirubrobacteraceae bacterium]